MKRSKFSEEQMMYAIRQAEAGTPVGDLCRQLGVSDATFYAWKKKYAHLSVSGLRPFRILTVVDHWSRQSPVLEAVFGCRVRPSAKPAKVSLAKGRDHDRSQWIMGRNSNHGRSRPIGDACTSTSFGRANP